MNGISSQNSASPEPLESGNSGPRFHMSSSAAYERIKDFIGHRVKILHMLQNQYLEAVDKDPEKTKVIETIYNEAINRIETLQNFNIYNEALNRENQLSKTEISKLKKQLKEFDKEATEIILEAQINTISKLSSKTPSINKKVATLARGGRQAKLIRLMASISTNSTSAKALKAYNNTKQFMDKASKMEIEGFDPKQATIVNAEKNLELKKNLDRRAGVIGINGIYRISPAFSKKEIKKQISSFIVQNLSEQERKTFEKEIEIGPNKFKSRIIPLNAEFDKSLVSKGTLSAVFSEIMGKLGIVSSNRQEAHLINGFESNLILKGQTVLRFLRHAVISDKLEKDPEIRKKNSRQAAEELLKAALLQEISDQGLTLEDARDKGIELNLNSVSLLTPDNARPRLNRIGLGTLLKIFGKKELTDERILLNDQVQALKSFNGEQIFTLDKVNIPVKVKINAFNFGVNAGSVGTKKGPVTIRIGLKNQYRYNLEAWKGMRGQVQTFRSIIKSERQKLSVEISKSEADIKKIPLQDGNRQRIMINRMANLMEKQAGLILAENNIKRLMKDIENMLQDKEAYLRGDNQFEIGAKIVILSNLMNDFNSILNNEKKNSEKLNGVKCSINCKSGKDRTGFMDAVAKTFVIMSLKNGGKYHSRQEIINGPEIRKEFGQVLLRVLKEDAGLEITGLNTGKALGFKVDETARIFGMSLKDFLIIAGLSDVSF